MNIHKFCIRFVLLLGFLLLINQEASSKISSFSTERSEVRLKTYKNKNVRKPFRQNINKRKIRVILTILILGVGSVGVKLMQVGFSSAWPIAPCLQCCTMQCCAMQCYAMQCCAIQCGAMQCCAMQCLMWKIASRRLRVVPIVVDSTPLPRRVLVKPPMEK